MRTAASAVAAVIAWQPAAVVTKNWMTTQAWPYCLDSRNLKDTGFLIVIFEYPLPFRKLFYLSMSAMSALQSVNSLKKTINID